MAQIVHVFSTEAVAQIAKMFSSEFCENFEDTFSQMTPPVTASEQTVKFFRQGSYDRNERKLGKRFKETCIEPKKSEN